MWGFCYTLCSTKFKDKYFCFINLYRAFKEFWILAWAINSWKFRKKKFRFHANSFYGSHWSTFTFATFFITWTHLLGNLLFRANLHTENSSAAGKDVSHVNWLPDGWFTTILHEWASRPEGSWETDDWDARMKQNAGAQSPQGHGGHENDGIGQGEGLGAQAGHPGGWEAAHCNLLGG